MPHLERPITCIVGIVLAALAIWFRLDVGVMFAHYSWGGAIETSPDYQRMLAWTDIFNIAIVTGIAVAIIGWVVPRRRPPSSDKP